MLEPSAYLGCMDHALKQADLARECDEVPVGAVVIQNGRVVGEGYNQRESTNDPIGHAEIYALRDASKRLGSWRLIGCSLVVTLEPCVMCLGAASQARVDEVIYAASDPKGGALSLGYRVHEDQRMNHRFEVRQQSDLRAEQILKDFFMKKRQERRSL